MDNILKPVLTSRYHHFSCTYYLEGKPLYDC